MTAPSAISAFAHDLFDALRASHGLILVAGPAGNGKTTAIEGALAERACPGNPLFLGDIRSVEQARHAVSVSRERLVIAVLRIPRAAGVFERLVSMSVPAIDLAELVQVAFSTRLCRPEDTIGGTYILLHECLAVTDAIRALVLSGANPDVIHQQARADGMRSLRQAGLAEVAAGRLAPAIVSAMTPDD